MRTFTSATLIVIAALVSFAMLGCDGKPPPEPTQWEYRILSMTELLGVEKVDEILPDPNGPEPQTPWDKTLSTRILQRLNELGADGWELVSAEDNSYGSTYIFKRPL